MAEQLSEDKTSLTIDVFLHGKKEVWEEEYRYSIHNNDMEEYGYTVIATRNITFKLPSRNAQILLEISAKKKQLSAMRAKACVAETALKEELQKLLSISALPGAIDGTF